MNKTPKINLQKCPCGSANDYVQCCGQFIAGDKIPETPEQLMRSRYTAYTIADVDYIEATMRDDVLSSFDRKESSRWATQSKWLGLKIIRASEVNSTDLEGDVEFIVSYIQNHQVQHLKEHSKFKKYDDRWFFVGDFVKGNLEDNSAAVSPAYNANPQIKAIKTGRNDACHCGSGKKYKKCCLA